MDGVRAGLLNPSAGSEQREMGLLAVILDPERQGPRDGIVLAAVGDPLYLQNRGNSCMQYKSVQYVPRLFSLTDARLAMIQFESLACLSKFKPQVTRMGPSRRLKIGASPVAVSVAWATFSFSPLDRMHSKLARERWSLSSFALHKGILTRSGYQILRAIKSELRYVEGLGHAGYDSYD